MTLTYPGGRELCGSYVAGEPERFSRLLTEQVRVRDLLEAQAGRCADTLDKRRRFGRSSALSMNRRQAAAQRAQRGLVVA